MVSWDPVHLVQVAYQELADHINVPENNSGDDSDQASVSILGTAEAGRKKKIWPEAVITASAGPQPKCDRTG